MKQHLIILFLLFTLGQTKAQELITEFSPTEIEKLNNVFRTWPFDSLVTVAGKQIVLGGTRRQFSNDNTKQIRKRFEGAILMLNAAIDKNLKDASAHSWRGIAYENISEFQLALIDFSKASRLDPNNFKYYEHKAECKQELEDYYGAIADYKMAISKTNSREYSPYHKLLANLGLCYMNLDNNLLALENIEEAIKLNSEISQYYIIRGATKLQLKKVKEACLDFSRAGELGDSRAFTLINEYCK